MTLMATLFLTIGMPARLSLPSGFYTLREVGEALARQGVPVRVDDPAQGDLYALRLVDLEWPAVQRALVADGRLTIVERDGTFTIARQADNRQSEAQALTRYLGFIRNRVHAVYGTVTQRCRTMARSTAQEREALIARGGPDKEVEELYRQGNGEIPFAMISVPAALSDPQAPTPFSKVRVSNWLESPGYFVPSGSLRDFRLPGNDFAKMSDEEIVASARATPFCVKLTLDPVSGAMTQRIAGYSSRDGRWTMFAFGPEAVAPTRVKLRVPASAPWGKQSLADQAERGARSEAVLRGLTAAVSLPERDSRASEALLWCAERTGRNLVAHVASFTDLPLPALGRASMADVIAHVNAERIEWVEIEKAARERGAVGEAVSGPLPFRPEHRLTVTATDGVVVVRDESRFLDGLGVKESTPSTKLLNAHWSRNALTLGDCAADFARMKPRTWPSSIFVSSALDFANPTTFYPIAATISKSPKLLASLDRLADDNSVRIAVGSLESEASRALVAALLECGNLSDVVTSSSAEPMAMPATLGGAGASDLSIVARRGAGAYSFTVLKGEYAIWGTWVRNLRPARP